MADAMNMPTGRTKGSISMGGEFTLSDRLVSGTIYLIVGVLGCYLCVCGLKSIRALPAPRGLLYYHLYVANLCISVCSLFASLGAYQGGWQFGDFGCQMYATVAFLAGMGAILITSLLPMEAYFSVRFKDAYSMLTVNQYRVVLVLVWLKSACWALAPLLGWSSYSLEPVGVTCEISWLKTDNNHASYMAALILFGYTIPFGVAGCLLLLTFCGALPKDEPMKWTIPSQNHSNAILKASALHLVTSLLAWGPYSVICLLPYSNQSLVLPPLLIIFPSIMTKAVLSLQPLILPYCSELVAQIDRDKPHHN